MKPYQSSSNDILHLYPNRNFVSLSTKLAANPYTKPQTYNFNSPKNDPQKNIIFSTRNQSDPNKYVKKSEKPESGLERKNSKGPEAQTPKASQMSSTLNSFGTSPRYGVKPKPADDKRNSVEKLKNSTQEIYGGDNKYTTKKVTESVNLRDTLKGDNSLNRSKNLEISTEFAAGKGVVPTPKAQTTKSKDLSDKVPQNESYKKNVVSQYSFEFNTKFSSKLNGTNSTNTTEPNDDKIQSIYSNNSKTQSNLNNRYQYPDRPTSSYEKSYSQDRSQPQLAVSSTATQKKYQQYEAPQMNYPGTTTNKGSSVKVNNFFGNSSQTYESQKAEKDGRPLNKSQKVDYEVYDNEEIITKSTELTKKIFSKTQQDLKQTLRGISAEPTKKEEIKNPLNPQKENIQLSQKQEIANTAKPQQPNLNSFITKVNRGEIFSTATVNKPTPQDDTPTRKPYIGLEEKLANKTPKSSSNLVSKSLVGVGPRTTTNQDSKSFTFTNSANTTQNSSALVSQTPKNSTSQSQDLKLQQQQLQLQYQQQQQQLQLQQQQLQLQQQKASANSGKGGAKPQTPSSRNSQEVNTSQSSFTQQQQQVQQQQQQQEKKFIYYMAGLEKYHKSYIESDYFCQIYREHFMQTYQAMMFCRYLKTVDPKVLGQKRVFLSKRESHKGKSPLLP
jgi:hypothetical protein